jgi:hypothetical protein
MFLVALYLLTLLFGLALSTSTQCDVAIVGGSEAAIAASLSSSLIAQGSHQKICLFEPTDWVGGQLTLTDPAPDFAWEGPFARAAFARENNNADFYEAVLAGGDPGGCWVSRSGCFVPGKVAGGLGELARARGVHIVYSAVLKRVVRDGASIEAMEFVVRTVKPPHAPYGRPFSAALADWYAREESDYFFKSVVTVRASVFIDASEWGEALALSRVPYMQGADTVDGEPDTDNGPLQMCGQAMTFAVAQRAHSANTTDIPAVPTTGAPPDSAYSFTDNNKTFPFGMIWAYRRVLTTPPGSESYVVRPGDLSIQNWTPGNDYPAGYIFLNRSETMRQVEEDAWVGGVDIAQLQRAEEWAYGFHNFIRRKAPEGPRITLDRGTVFGSSTGLSVVPYLRDSRRAVGIDGFVMPVRDIVLGGTSPSNTTGVEYPDSLAIGLYDVDLHALDTCAGLYPPWTTNVTAYTVLPFYLPLRALTVDEVPNLIVAGKTMATSFLVNAAARVHPVEWASGAAAGATAAYMVQRGLTDTRQALKQADQIRAQNATPSQWKF